MKNFRALLVIVALALLSGCASVNAPKADPLESINRVTFKFNEVVDDAVLIPVAKGYRAVTPQPVRTGVANVFSNLGEVTVAVNSLLQGKVENAVSDVGRLVVNSTIGILGLFDVATQIGLEKHSEDFGQTLGKWGLGSGPYLVMPLMGPSTLRDAAAIPLNFGTGYTDHIHHVPTRNSVWTLDLVKTRESLLGASESLDTAALDKYQFMRDAYLQRRLNQVYDGKVPSKVREQLIDDLEPPEPPAKSAPK